MAETPDITGVGSGPLPAADRRAWLERRRPTDGL